MIYKIQNLKYSYDGERQVLDGANLELKEGELLTVLGRNGAGKSTLFSCMLGLLKPYEGNILLDGKEISSLKERDIASLVSYVPQTHSPAFGYTVFDFVLMGCASKVGMFSKPGQAEERAALNALDMLGMIDFADRFYGELSGGEMQQIAIARALASNPKAILFDEPTSHLDYTNQIKVLKIIKKLSGQGFAIAVTTHDPNHALLLDGSIALFDAKGTVESGSVKDLVTEEKLINIYGSDLKIRYSEEFKRNVCIYPSL